LAHWIAATQGVVVGAKRSSAIWVAVLLVAAALNDAVADEPRTKRSARREAASAIGADAETGDWTVTLTTSLYRLPGEVSAKLASLPVGARVRVLGRKGRWLRARYRGQLGWIIQSTAEPLVAPPARSVEVDPESWRAGSIRVAGVAKAVALEPGPREPGRTGAERGRPDQADGASHTDHARHHTAPRLRARTRVGVGASSFGSSFRSDGQSELAEYQISANTSMVVVATELVTPALRRFAAVVDASYAIALGTPGIRYQGSAEASDDRVSFALHDVDVGGRLGVQLPLDRAIFAAVRIGWHDSWFHVDDINDNPGKLARESLRGLVVGVRMDGALGRNLITRFAMDWLASGRRRQTPGLEDGESAHAAAVWASLAVAYTITSTIAVDGGYGLGWSHTRWSGVSTRQSDVMSAQRDDRTHSFLFSLCKSFQ
jgi:hypothetical protein